MKKTFLLIMSIYSSQLSSQTITNYTIADGLISDFVECIAADVNDNIWFGTSVGIQKFDGANWITYTTADGLVNDNVKVITAASNGNIWVGTDFGSSQFDGTSWVIYDNTNGLNSSQVKSIDEDVNGGIWVGTNQGVSYFDGNTWESYSSPRHHPITFGNDEYGFVISGSYLDDVYKYDKANDLWVQLQDIPFTWRVIA